MTEIDLHAATEAGAVAMYGMDLSSAAIAIGPAGLVLDLPRTDIARLVLTAAAPLIEAAARADERERIAREIEAQYEQADGPNAWGCLELAAAIARATPATTGTSEEQE